MVIFVCEPEPSLCLRDGRVSISVDMFFFVLQLVFPRNKVPYAGEGVTSLFLSIG